jgi:hypothetical protein
MTLFKTLYNIKKSLIKLRSDPFGCYLLIQEIAEQKKGTL